MVPYDGFNRLIKTTKGSTVAEYAYKGDGLRLSKNVNGNLTTHVWDGSNIVADLDNEGAIKDKYIRGLELIESDLNGTYVYNAHGDVVQLVNGNREATKEYWYDAFGVEEDIDEGDTNPWRYGEEYFDSSSGTYYLRNRYYNPNNGRFLTEDPIRDGLNFYVYANNNPVRFVDPSGLEGILLDYIQQKNTEKYGRDFSYNISTKNKKSYVGLTIDGVTNTYQIGKNGVYYTDQGTLIFESDLIVKDYGLSEGSVTHQERDVFESIEDVVLAWGLKYYPKSKSEGKEYGSVVYGDESYGYYFGDYATGTGNSVSVVDILDLNSEDHFSVAIMHTHPWSLKNAVLGTNFEVTSDEDIGVSALAHLNKQVEGWNARNLPVYTITPKGKITRSLGEFIKGQGIKINERNTEVHTGLRW